MNIYSTPVPTRLVLKDSEEASLLTMAQHLGIDFGEFDGARDNETNLIYIFDANPTPNGPPNGISSQSGKLALHLLGSALDKYLTTRTAEF